MKKNKILVDSGVSVAYRTLGKQVIKIPLLNYILLALLSVLTAVSSVMTFSTIMQLRITNGIIIPATVGFAVLFSCLYVVIKKHKWIVLLSATLMCVGVVLLFYDEIFKGVNVLYYQALDTIYKAMQWDITYKPTYVWNDSFYTQTNLVIATLSFLLSAAISYFIIVRTSFIAILFLTFPFFEIGAAFGAVPDYTYVYFMVGAWTSILAYSKAVKSKIKTKFENGKFEKRIVPEIKGRFAVSAVAIALVTIMLFPIISSLLNSVGFKRTKDVDMLRKDIKYVATDLVDYITGEDNDGSLKEGKLLELGDRVIKDRHYFTLQTSMPKTEEHIKIKGYTATIYKNNQWQQTENYDNYKTLFKKLNGFSYRLGGINGNLLSSHKDYKQFEGARMDLMNFRRKKDYAYETYFADFDSDFTANMDTSIRPLDNSSYSYNMYSRYEYLFKIPESEIYKSDLYKDTMELYTKFVNKEYVTSAATPAVKKLASSFKAKNSYELVDDIRYYFKENFKHTFLSSKCPENEDFVERFLFKTKSGYSAHFATAAVVMLQSQGVPARYVEGYFIPKDDFNKTESEHEYGYITFDVTDRYAHAWIEVYNDTYGWIPVEVAPGYWSEPFKELMKKYEHTPGNEESPETQGTEEVEDLTDDVEDPQQELEEGETEPITIVINIGIVLVIIAAVILLIVLFIMGWFCYLSIVRHVRNRRLLCDDSSIVLKEGYKYFQKLAAFDGVGNKNVYHYMSYAENIARLSEHLDFDSTKEFFRIMLKNNYSNNSATLDEIRFVSTFVLKYRKDILSGLNIFKKFNFKIIKAL